MMAKTSKFVGTASTCQINPSNGFSMSKHFLLVKRHAVPVRRRLRHSDDDDEERRELTASHQPASPPKKVRFAIPVRKIHCRTAEVPAGFEKYSSPTPKVAEEDEEENKEEGKDNDSFAEDGKA